jgi:signal transduction histidine kinase
MVDRAFEGFEGSGETVTSRGVPMLISIKRMSMAPWFLATSYPQSEAYAPLRKAERYFAMAAVTGTILFLLVTWQTMKRLMAPLAIITRHVAHLPEKQRHEHHIAVNSADEIGILAAAFNTMIDTLDRQQDELRDQKQKIDNERGLLEKEVVKRQVAQEALSGKQQQLEELNSLLRGINDELEERISRAVSEIRQKDRILIQQQRQAAMGEMINNIAHQWRQPLNNIALIIQNMMQSREYGELSEDQMRADVGQAMETIRFMSQTIDDFRNYFLPDKEKGLFSVRRAVNRTISIIAGSNGKTKISVESDDGDDPVIYGYMNEYSQVLLNILINARDALAERNIGTPEIKIVIRSENGKTVVTIGDNAGGIPESIIDRIFDPYFSTKSPDKGTGVGLFMSKNIIEGNMNGSLTVCNSGEGAEFRIEV